MLLSLRRALARIAARKPNGGVPVELGMTCGRLGRSRAMRMLAMLALGLLALRPFCDLAFSSAHAAHPASVASVVQSVHKARGLGESSAGNCCARVKDISLLPSTESLLGATTGETPAAAIFAERWLPAAPVRVPTRLDLGGPPQRAFYARTARIRR